MMKIVAGYGNRHTLWPHNGHVFLLFESVVLAPSRVVQNVVRAGIWEDRGHPEMDNTAIF
jgi:hypothetical protein